MAHLLEFTPNQLRRNLGILGISLPIILAVFSRFKIEPSISDFYYTDLGIVFTGILISFGLFLYSYKGYEKEDEWISDDHLTNLAGFFAIVTALVPDKCAYDICAIMPPNGHQEEWISKIHLISASLFFVFIGWMSFFHFTRNKSPERKMRNRLYKVCGLGVWISVILAGLSMNFEGFRFTSFDVFIYETIGLWFFGTAWLVKGDVLKKLGI